MFRGFEIQLAKVIVTLNCLCLTMLDSESCLANLTEHWQWMQACIYIHLDFG